ncbi:hypothetical protein PDJAM_G00163050 [Pangasius djambal]|uniref:Uncharacterized protein n=1 Tax=Pangasius djambal TaxID=1691987 RepID=A0ACC5ZMF6_9TELE|nr:hypothetical protein [Pangasius djambal]
MAWIQLLLFSFLSFTPLTTLSRSGSEDEPESPFKSICEGVRTELRNCNKRLLEKTEYSFNIEKDMFALKEQLREIRILCINASQASAVQIAALQNQLDRMLKQLGEQATGPTAVVLNILQKYVEVQKLELNLLIETDLSKIAELQKQLKKSRADLEEVNGNLDKLECQAVNNSQILHVVSLQQQIDELRKTGGSKSSSQILVLETQLEKEMRHLEENEDAASKLIKPIIRLQDEIVELYERQALLLIIHIQFTAFQSRLDEKKILLSDLQKEKEEKGDDGNINEQIEAVEREVRQLEAKIDDLKKNLSQKPELLNKVEELTAKVNDSNLRQILDIVSLKQEINNLEDRIRSETSKSKRNELQKELREKKEQLDSKTKELQTNEDLNTRITLTIISKLDDLRKLQIENVGVDQIKDKRDELLGLLSELDDSNLAKILLKNLFLLSDESQLKKLISHLKQQTNKQIAELQEEVRKKEEELRRKTTELGQKDRDVATLTKEIRDLEEELKNLKKQLKDLENTLASQLRELEKQLSEMRKELEKGNKALQEKDAELAKKDLEKQLSETRKELEKGNKALQEKDEELAKKDVIDDNKCLRDDMTRLNERVKELEKLEEQLKKKEEELSHLINNTAAQPRSSKQSAARAEGPPKKKHVSSSTVQNFQALLVGSIPASSKEAEEGRGTGMSAPPLPLHVPSGSFSQEDLNTVSLAASDSLVEPEQSHCSLLEDTLSPLSQSQQSHSDEGSDLRGPEPSVVFSLKDTPARTMATMADAQEMGLGNMPPVGTCISSLVVSPDEALKQNLRCPNPECRRTDDLLVRVYNTVSGLGPPDACTSFIYDQGLPGGHSIRAACCFPAGFRVNRLFYWEITGATDTGETSSMAGAIQISGGVPQ